ncbi:hypothetical protein BE20_16495 [Sorangium cellulosum]|uniref:Uncharacterized protein n=1 Tax=Sorangium cellulosum TaxID=56 RepID=A0A150SEK6_SORCE|nr:hypothetical protein BE20_16495 [Sorangium cellulosum]KYF94366.1 hypothetical protein BE18_37435 [Sorangium cellulosum]
MSTMARARPAGARAAAALLTLLDEHTPEDFEAARRTLGARNDLVQVLTLLAAIKRHDDAESGSEERASEAAAPPAPKLSVEFLRNVVAAELRALRISEEVVADLRRLWNTNPLPRRKGEPVARTVERLLEDFDEQVDAPSERVKMLVTMLRRTAEHLGPERQAFVEAMLRKFAETALAENTLVYPTLASLGELRTRWAPSALRYEHEETREHLAERLVNDAVRLVPASHLDEVTLFLLQQGLRSPTDRLRARVKKSHVS